MAFGDAQTTGRFAYTESPATIELVGTVSLGDALGYDGGWKRALATSGSVVQLRCVAGEDGVSGQRITAYFGTCLIDVRISGATPGGAMYVAEGSDDGEYVQTAPSTSGDANTIVGYALTATRIAIVPSLNVDSVA